MSEYIKQYHQDKQSKNPGNVFGMTWGGQLEIASRLIHGFDPSMMPIVQKELNLNDEQAKNLNDELHKELQFPIPYDILALQDCIDLAIFLIRGTMILHRLAVTVRGVGGPVEVAVITRTGGIEFVQKKKIQGEERTDISGG